MKKNHSLMPARDALHCIHIHIAFSYSLACRTAMRRVACAFKLEPSHGELLLTRLNGVLAGTSLCRRTKRKSSSSSMSLSGRSTLFTCLHFFLLFIS